LFKMKKSRDIYDLPFGDPAAGISSWVCNSAFASAIPPDAKAYFQKLRFLVGEGLYIFQDRYIV